MTRVTGETEVLAYATGSPADLSKRGWRILLWVGAIHLLVLLVPAALSVRGFVFMGEFLRDARVYNWFVMGMLGLSVGLPVMILANSLAVAGYAAGLNGRSPRRWFLIYVPTQIVLMLIMYGLAVAMAAASPYQVTPNSSMGMHKYTAAMMPVGYIVINLPLLLLLFPRIRRSCFTR